MGNCQGRRKKEKQSVNKGYLSDSMAWNVMSMFFINIDTILQTIISSRSIYPMFSNFLRQKGNTEMETMHNITTMFTSHWALHHGPRDPIFHYSEGKKKACYSEHDYPWNVHSYQVGQLEPTKTINESSTVCRKCEEDHRQNKGWKILVIISDIKMTNYYNINQLL